ncbi:trypsin-like peptidase domain-containing protein [Kitasatospora sp. NPDC006697]|uniref:nSTAND1 domain-containing NTPase n=1 Tax=Kitasatospora sp. NPDC006697 TaxID=3364020 RepID=UPI0036B7D346
MGTGPKALNAAVVRILKGPDDPLDPTASAEPVGLGFLVTPELAVTCAHVVSAALGILGGGEPSPWARLDVDLPLLPSAGRSRTAPQRVSAGIVHWVPPEPNGAGDVAVVRLSAPVPGAQPIRLIEAQEVWGHSARAFGFPSGRDGGVWHSAVLRARQANGWVQADRAADGYRVSGGFSGSPVWDETLAGVIGMVVRAEAGEPPASYLIPTDELLTSWPELRALVLPPSPFRSLSAFQEADEPLFHGRSTESGELAALVARQQWTTIVGPSGSGKSSLAMAGVIPRLRAGGAAAVVLRPAAGSSPLSALAATLLPLLEPDLSETDRLARIPDLTRVFAGHHGLADVVPRILQLQRARQLVVLVDQSEELLALSPDTVGRLADVLFDDALPKTVRVLTTLRADFMETALAHPRLGLAFGHPAYVLRPLRPEQLREVITAPIDAVPGLDYQAGLVDTILRDTGSEPGALPLLGFTLDLLWQQQSGGLLTHQAYEDLGRVTGALRYHADQVWAEYVSAEEEAAARRLLIRLIQVPEETAAATRRIALRSELAEDEWRIAQHLAATRLLVAGSSAEGADTVELAHEALITGWPKLSQWAAADRAFLVWRESLRHDRERWERGDRVPELLPTTVALATSQQWVRERSADLSEAERDYLERGRRRHRSRSRRRGAFIIGLGFVLALALVFGSLFAYARQQSQSRAATANSEALVQASQNEAGDDPVLETMLSLAAYRTAPTQEARDALLRQYLTRADSTRILSGLKGTTRSVRASKDGNVVLTGTTQGRATLFVHAVTGVMHREDVPSAYQIDDVMLSGDGRRAAFLDDNGSVEWFDVDPEADQPIGAMHTLAAAPGMGPASTPIDDPGMAMVTSLSAMSADGRMIAVATQTRLAWWDLDSGSVVGTAPAPARLYRDLWISPDHRTVLARTEGGADASEGLVAVDLATGATRTVLNAKQFLLSGDRTTAVACRTDGDSNRGVVTRYAVADGTQQGQPYHPPADACPILEAVDGTGHQVVTTDFSGSTPDLQLVDLEHNTVVSRTNEPRGSSDDAPMNAPDLVSNGLKLFLISQRKTQVVYTEIPTDDGPLHVSQSVLTPDGSKMISILADGSALDLRTATMDDSRLLAQSPRAKPSWDPQEAPLAQTRDGRLLAEREGVNLVSVRETSNLRQTVQIKTAMPPSVIPSVFDFDYFFDATGNLITLSGTLVQQWDVHTGQQLAQFDTSTFHPKTDDDGSLEILVSPYPAANQVAVIVYGNPQIRVVDLTTGRTTMTLELTDDIKGVNFDSSARYFAVLRAGGRVEVWRRDPLHRELALLRSITPDTLSSSQFAVGFLDDNGRFEVAANNEVQIYQVGGHTSVGSYDFGRPADSTSASPYSFLSLSADGRTVLYLDDHGFGGPLALDPAQWQRKLCDVIGYREFTPDERAGLPVPVPAQRLCPRP